MLTGTNDLVAGAVSTYELEGISGVFDAHSTGVIWNGAECPLFTLEQVKAFFDVLNKDSDFDAKVLDGEALISIESLGEEVRIKALDGFFEFAGWCFISVVEIR